MLEIPNHPINMGLEKYIAEENAIERIGTLSAIFGKRVFVIGGPTALEKTKKRLERCFQDAKIDYVFRYFKNVCSLKQVNMLKDEAKKFSADLLIGVGGGKAIDTTKAVAYYMKVPVITVPTIAATCSAWAPLSVMYSDQGVPIGGLNTYAPEFVVCDYTILLQNPKRFIAAGLGDSLAKWPELGIASSKITNTLYLGGIKLAHFVFEKCLQLGDEVSKNVSNFSFENTLISAVDLTIPITGLVSELTSGAMGGSDLALIAHGVDNGLLAVSEETHSLLHGERVTFGIVPHLLIHKAPQEHVQQVIDFIFKLGLPLEFKDIGLEKTIIPILAEKVLVAPGIKDAGISSSQIRKAFYDYQELVVNFKKTKSFNKMESVN